MKQVDRARKELRIAEENLSKAIYAAFPVGTQAGYSQGASTISCTVIEVYRDRVHIRGASGKEHWINSYRLRK